MLRNLKHVEQPVAAAQPRLAEQHLAGAVELDRDRHDQQQRREQDEGGDADRQIERALLGPARQRQAARRDGDGRLAVEIADAERTISGELRHDDLAAHIGALQQPAQVARRSGGQAITTRSNRATAWPADRASSDREGRGDRPSAAAVQTVTPRHGNNRRHRRS